MKGLKIGEIFVGKGLITRLTLERALLRARRTRQKLGFVLEEMEVITGSELAEALAAQHGYRVVADFARYQYPADLLTILPIDLAMRHLAFPLKKDASRLALAMADPGDTRLLTILGEHHRLQVMPMVASRTDIIAAINRHYLGKSPSAPQTQTVLIAEDNKLVAMMLATALKGGGYRVLQAIDGMEAYKLTLSELPHIILTDKEMPKMSGYALFDALKKLPETRHIPILLLTGTQNPDDEATAFEKGFFDFLVKPVRDITLLARVKRAFQTLEQTRSEGYLRSLAG